MRTAALFALGLFATPAWAAFDVFLSYPGIPGDSVHIAYPNQIDVTSVQVDAFRVGTVGDVDNLAAPKLAEVKITKIVDNASPLLMIASLEGAPATQNAVFSFQRTGGSSASSTGSFYTITLTRPVVTSYAVEAASGDDVPEETVTFGYESLCITHRPQGPTGTLGSPVTRCWNAATNTSSTSI